MKIARITSDGKLLIKGELIEYPSELEGGRNLWLKLSDIDLTDYAIGHAVEYPVNDRFNLIGYGDKVTSRINLGNELNVVFSESSISGAYVRGNIINLLPNTIYTLSYTLSHEGDMEGKTLLRLFNRLRYTSSDNGLRFSDVITTNNDGTFDFRFWQDNAGLSSMNITFTISDIKLEIGDKATTWTPAPEDLGLTYDNYINYFTTGLKNNGNLFVGEIIEYPSELSGGRNLLRGSSDFSSDLWVNIKSVTTSTLNDNYSMAKVTGPYPSGPNTLMKEQGWNFEIGKPYIVSVYAKSDNVGDLLGVTAQTANWQPKGVSSEWERYSWSFIATNDRLARFRFEANNNASIWITQPQIEKGNIATDWTPAPEDLGLWYSDDIQYFNMGIKEGRLMVTELIENAIL